MSFFSNTPKSVHGTISKAELLPVSEASPLIHTADSFLGDVVPLPGKSFQPLIFAPKSAKFTDSSKETKNGLMFSYVFEAKLSGLSPAVAMLLYKNREKLFYIKVWAADSVLLLCDMGLTFQMDHPGRVVNYSGYPIRFDSRSSLPVLYVES